MPTFLASRVVRALCLLSGSNRVRVRPLVSSGRSFRLHSNHSRANHKSTARLKQVRLIPPTRPKFINNLHPHSINPKDYIDLSGRYDFRSYFHQEDIGTPSFTRFFPGGSGTNRFPAGCRGFLYFHEDPRGRFNVSGIRFRIAQEPTQTAFDAGEDYWQDGSNEPWTCSLWLLASRHQPGYSKILQRLYQDGLVDPDYVAERSRIVETSGLFVGRCPSAGRVLTSFDEPFEIELSGGAPRYYVLELQQSRLIPIDLRVIPRHNGRAPYEGRCIIRLEKLDEKSTSSGGTCLTYHIRVLTTLTPIECTVPGYKGVLPPTAGSLIRRSVGPVTKRLFIKSTYKPSPDTITQKMGSELTPALPGRQISTLNPGQLKYSDHLDFRDKVTSICTSAKAVVTRGAGLQEYAAFVSNKVPLHSIGLDKYASGKKGFLYFHQSHPNNPLSGSIRFRLSEQPTIDAFHQAEDLIHPLTGSTWELPLLRLIIGKNFQPLVGQLLQDGLITPETINTCKRLISRYPKIPAYSTSIVLYELDQPFVMDLRQASHTVYYIDSDHRWDLRATSRKSQICTFLWNSCPYTGQCLVRLEEVTTETPSGSFQHVKTVRIRVLKIIEPLGWRDPNKPHGKLPTEGSLLPLRFRRGLPADLAYLVADPKLCSADHEVKSCS